MKNNLIKFTLIDTLFAILLQNNIIYLSFQSFLQLKSTFFFTFIDKINILFAIIFLFFTFFFSFAFYISVNWIHPKYLNFYTQIKFKDKISIFYFAFSIFLRTFATGFVHSYLLENGQIQLLILFFIKAVIIICLIHIKNEIIKTILFFELVYYLSGFLLDFLIFMCNVSDYSTYLSSYVQIFSVI